MLPPFIQNISFPAIKSGNHFDGGERAVLIQIIDPAVEYPTPRVKFDQVYQFSFLDIDENEKSSLKEFAITQDQAQSISEILTKALEEQRNVIVHCHAGLCRSGAVAEVGIMLGFRDTKSERIPNMLVKKLLIQWLRLGYCDTEENETSHTGPNYSDF